MRQVIGHFLHSVESENNTLPFLIHPFDFFLLVFSTVLIAGAGYIINDYFDIRIDRINKPEKVIVGKYIKKRLAMLTHTGMNLIAVLIGVYLSIKYDSWLPVIFHFTTTAFLWWYSVQLKRKFFSGNLVIAVLSGMVPLLVGWFELPAIKNEYVAYLKMGADKELFLFTWWLIIGYSILAASTTLIREILKDMADVKGDESQHCKTIPIVIGIPKTKYFVNILLLGSIFTISGLQMMFFTENIQFFYVVCFISLPLLTAAVITHYAQDRNRFLTASDFVKISMLAAILFTFLI